MLERRQGTRHYRSTLCVLAEVGPDQGDYFVSFTPGVLRVHPFQEREEGTRELASL